MRITDRFEFDVVIMGAGLAGMTAAAKMAEDHPRLKVAVLTKVHPVRSHSGAAQGGINAAVAPDDKWSDHYYDTLKGGAFLGDQDAVRALTEEAPEAIFELDRWGVMFDRLPDGGFAQRPFGGQRRNRTCYVQDLTGHALLSTMYEVMVKKGVAVFDEWFAFAVVADGGRFFGFLAFDLKTGRIGWFGAKAGLIATGGAGRIFGQSSNALINTGDGMALAWRAGAPLKDIEFFQFHPTGIYNGILITEGARGEGGYLVNKDGERFMARYAPKFMELAPRDLVARSIHTEIAEGRGFDDGCVRLDLRHLGAEKIKERLPQIREIAMYFAGVDPIDAPIPVRPTVHYTMGGVHVDVNCATPLRGLYAAGEASCVSVHGANRLGGNSLLETVVFGRRAARAIPAALDGAEPAPAAAIDREMAAFVELFGDNGSENVAVLRADLEKAMVGGFGLKREAASMAVGLREMDALAARWTGVRVRERNLIFNTELVRALELRSMLDVGRACAHAALARRESRGGHFRYDFPKMDNANFLKHSLVATAPNGDLALGELPVTIVDVPPLDEIKY